MKKTGLFCKTVISLILMIFLCACGQKIEQAPVETETTAIQEESESNSLSEKTEEGDPDITAIQEENESNSPSEKTEEAAPDISFWMGEGWLGPTKLSLCGEEGQGGITWSTVGTPWDTDREAFFMMTFYPGDEMSGRLDLDWIYTGEEEYEELWSGFWKLKTETDKPSSIAIELTLVGGKGYDTTEGPRYISDLYRLLLDLSGEYLMISPGQDKVCLPFMTDQITAWVLEQAKG